MNKYLEKIAGMPRFIGRAMKDGIKATVADAKGMGARAARSDKARAHALHMGNIKADSAEAYYADGRLKSMLTGSGKDFDRATELHSQASRRFRRTEQANHLAQRGAGKALKIGAAAVAGTAAAGTAAVAAAKKKD